MVLQYLKVQLQVGCLDRLIDWDGSNYWIRLISGPFKFWNWTFLIVIPKINLNSKWPDKSTKRYDMLHSKSYTKICNGHISQFNFKCCKSMPRICDIWRSITRYFIFMCQTFCITFKIYHIIACSSFIKLSGHLMGGTECDVLWLI